MREQIRYNIVIIFPLLLTISIFALVTALMTEEDQEDERKEPVQLVLIIGIGSFLATLSALLARKNLLFAEIASPIFLACTNLTTLAINYGNILGDVTWQMRRQQVSIVVVFMPVMSLFAAGTFLPHFIAHILFTLLSYDLV